MHMTVKEVLELSCMFLGKEELLESGYFKGEEIEESLKSEFEMLQKCLNLIVAEIATDYLPIYATKTAKTNGGELILDDIDENIFQIVKIQNEQGYNVKFKVLGEVLKVKSSVCTITYTKYASKADLNGNVETFSGKLSARVLAYGVAMEFSFISSLYDDASIWENRYKNSLFLLKEKKNNIIMPSRRWI